MATKRTSQLCKKGLHKMVPANTYQHPSKGAECRECKRDYMRDYMRELRAAAARKPAKRSTRAKSTRRAAR